MRIARIMISLAAAALALPAAGAERLPYTDVNTVGGRLEPVFGDVLKECGIDGFFRRGLFSSTRLSAIPAPLQNSLQLDAPYAWSDRESIARVFSYVYPADARAIGGLRDAKWLLSADTLPAAAATMLPDGLARIGFNFDCAGTVAAAIGSNASIDLSLAAMKSALSAKYSGTSKTTLTLSAGLFESPVLRLLSRSAPPADQVRGLMYLYDWYRRTNEQAQPYRLLATLDGLAMFESRQSVDSYQANADASVSARFPVFQVNGSSGAGVTTAFGVDITHFYVGVKGSGAQQQLRWEDMPGTAEVARRIGVFRTVLDERADPVVLPGLPVSHKQRLAGLPHQFCNTATWTVRPGDGAAGGLRLVAARPVKDGDGEACEFTVTYDVPARPAHGFRVQYAFEAINPMRGLERDVPFRIAAQDFVYQLSQSPELYPLAFDPHYASDAATGTIYWNVGFAIRDEHTAGDLTRPATVSAAVACPDGQLDLTAGPLVIQPVGKSAVLALRYLPSVELIGRLKDGSAKQNKCRVHAQVSFAARNQPQVQLPREVKFDVYFPSVAPAPLPQADGVASGAQ